MIVFLGLLACGWALPGAAYPEWAHGHQVWLPSGASGADIAAYVAEYQARNVSVAGTDVDSQW